MEGTLEKVFKDFTARRAALIRALTTEVDEFYMRCDPNEVNLYLFAYPDETWEVRLPLEEVPPEIPEPALGINFARDDTDMKNWLEYIAGQSDAWIMSLAFFFGQKFQFDQKTRARLFEMINDLPTISEVVIGGGRKPEKDKTQKSSTESNMSNPKSECESGKPAPPEEDGGIEGEDENILCGACGNIETFDEFWIFCDACGTWYHGSCVGITPAAAEAISTYMCPSCCNIGPSCRNKRQRH